jgi:hypothetical protein
MTLDQARSAFRSIPCNDTAAAYLELLVDYFADRLIAAEVFYAGLNEIYVYLVGNGHDQEAR